MKRSRATLLLAVFSLLLEAILAVAQTIREVRIDTSWFGITEGSERKVTHKAKNPSHREAIQALAGALAAPHVGGPDISNLGVAQEWLASERRSAPAYLAQDDAFWVSLSNPQILEEALNTVYFRIVVLDDYARVDATVLFDDGKTLELRSMSPYPLMLPWRIEGRSEESFNADISRALAALLPQKAPNRWRLLGANLIERLDSPLVIPGRSKYAPQEP